MADAENHSSAGDLSELEASWRQDGSPRLLLKLADEYRSRGRLQEAVALLEEGVEVHSDYLAARVALGRCRLDLGRSAAAARALEWVVRHDPTQLVANKLLVRAYLDLGEPAKALDRLEFYSLLNESDPEIATLGQAIRSAQAASPAGSPEVIEEAEGAEGVEEAEDDAEATSQEVLGGTKESGGDGFPGNGDGRGVHRVGAPTPFPVLLSIDRDAHLAALLAGGLFTIRERAWAEAPSDDAARDEAPVGTATVATATIATPAPPDVSSPPAEWPEGHGSILDEAEPPATVTLAQLYLDQGHLAEAEVIFRRALAADPTNAAAREGLEAISTRRGGPLTAAALLADAPAELSTKERKVWTLRAYLARLSGRS